MRLRTAAAVLALLALMAEDATAAAARLFTLIPHAKPGQALVLRLRTGVLKRGMEVDVYADGALLGTVSPFAIRGAAPAGTYTIPLSDAAARERRIRIRLVLTEAGKPDRAPTAREVGGVTLATLPVR